MRNIPLLIVALATLRISRGRAASGQSAKVPLTQHNIINAFGAPLRPGAPGLAQHLVDEQVLAGDPRAGQGGKPMTTWMPGYQKWFYPWMFAVISLDKPYDISSVFIFHGAGNSNFTVGLGATPFDITAQFAVNKSGYLTWQGYNVTAPNAQYVVVTMLEPTNLNELVLYGSPRETTEDMTEQTVTAAQRNIPLKYYFGANAFVNDPLSRLDGLNSIREYHDWAWDEGDGDPGYPHALNKFQPNYALFNNDDFYNMSVQAGIDTHVCIQGRTPFLTGGNASQSSWKPAPDSLIEDRHALVDPKSWVALAAHSFQVAARYGSKSVPEAQLQLAPGQAKLSGLGLLKNIEVTNEANAYWGSGEQFASPFEFTALMSAAYDGHEGTLGAGVGIKTADSDIRVVMGGLATAQYQFDYLKAMRLWAMYNRKDKDLPTDVINIHFYCGSDSAPGSSGKGSSPEDCQFQDVMRNVTSFRDQFYPKKQVWVTEFGYDTDPRSPNAALAYGSFNAQQGMWLVRSYMAALAAGVDRSHIFMLRDVVDNAPGKFATSGLVTQPGEWNAKESWYYVATLTHLLQNCTYVGTQVSGDVYIASMKRQGNEGPSAAYVLWLGTSKCAKASYKLDVPHGETDAVLVHLSGASTNGNQSSVTVQGQQLQLELSEMPILVLMGVKPEPPSGPVPPVPKPSAPECSNKPIGLYCNSTQGTNSTYIVCPDGEVNNCPDGDLCVQETAGTITCRTQPSPCATRPVGLYCDGAPAPGPGWGDEYVLCPSLEKFRCPTTMPKCVQNGNSVKCQ